MSDRDFAQIDRDRPKCDWRGCIKPLGHSEHHWDGQITWWGDYEDRIADEEPGK